MSIKSAGPWTSLLSLYFEIHSYEPSLKPTLVQVHLLLVRVVCKRCLQSVELLRWSLGDGCKV